MSIATSLNLFFAATTMASQPATVPGPVPQVQQSTGISPVLPNMAREIALGQIETLGTSCTVTGLLSRTNTGMIVTCRGGAWLAMDGFGRRSEQPGIQPSSTRHLGDSF